MPQRPKRSTRIARNQAEGHSRQVSFRAIFIAVVIGTALIVAAFLVNQRRPAGERNQASGALVAATGKCADCHRRETSAIIDQFERSRHATTGLSCLDCHRPADGQPGMDHREFTIAKTLTAKNCAQCHTTEYDQFARSRHAAPAWASVNGAKDMTPEQRALGERYHPGWVDRTPMSIGALEGPSALTSGCNTCHAVGCCCCCCCFRVRSVHVVVNLARPDAMPQRACFVVMAAQVVVGLAGLALHVSADLHRGAASKLVRFVFGAPASAPMLFADMALLAAIGLWAGGPRKLPRAA